MREQLQQYVELLFAGAPDSEDVKQEILQNTLDRYDDLIAQGKVPEAAYRLAISGIGDINEILGTQPSPVCFSAKEQAEPMEDPVRKKNRSIAIGIYITCGIPLVLLSELGYDTMGLCLTLLLVAAATVIWLMNREPSRKEGPAPQEEVLTPKQELHKSISSLVGIVTLIVYLGVSFWSGAWYITWLIFPLSGAVKGLIKAILDLKEAVDHEN